VPQAASFPWQTRRLRKGKLLTRTGICAHRTTTCLVFTMSTAFDALKKEQSMSQSPSKGTASSRCLTGIGAVYPPSRKARLRPHLVQGTSRVRSLSHV